MNKIKILVVEDDAIVAADLREILENLNYIVPATVSSCRDAVQKAEKLRPDLVLMDIMLEGKQDGIDAADKIRKKLDIPIIFITAYTAEDIIKRAKITEPFGYIVKPIDDRNLKICIEMALYKSGMEKKLREHQELIRKYAGRMLSVREEEKKKLAADLHDELGLMAVSLSSKLKTVEQDVENNNLKSALKDIKNTKSMLKKAVGSLKKLAMDLRPPNIDLIGLFSALEEYFMDICKQTGLNVDFKSDEKNNLKAEVAIALYRVTQEAFNNIVKHAKTKNVKVRLFTKGENIKYQISDDGRGFDVESVQNANKKMGIMGMNERVVSLGGNFIIKSVPGEGAVIDISIPAAKRRKR